MKKHTVVFTLCIIVVVVGYVAHSFVQAQCQKPNENTRACLESIPSDAVAWCTGTGQAMCTGTVYLVENFPEGVIPSTKGHTKEIMAPCYRTIPCVWNAKKQKCDLTDVWLLPPPVLAYRTVAKTDDEIDGSDKCKSGE